MVWASQSKIESGSAVAIGESLKNLECARLMRDVITYKHPVWAVWHMIVLVPRTQQLLALHTCRADSSLFECQQEAFSLITWIVISKILRCFQKLTYIRGTAMKDWIKHLSKDTLRLHFSSATTPWLFILKWWASRRIWTKDFCPWVTLPNHCTISDRLRKFEIFNCMLLAIDF